MANAKEKIESYDRQANDPGAWAYRAEHLFTAYRFLKWEFEKLTPGDYERTGGLPDRVAILFPALTLLAFGIECLLKGVWVKGGNVIASKGKYVPIVKNENHDLVKISDAVGLGLSEEERDVLHRLSTISRSIGRYPIPRNWQEHSPERLRWGPRSSGIFWRGILDDRVVEGLIESFRQKINS